jgi:hypothetical protein
VNSTFVKEEGYLIVGREGRLAAALLKNASRDLNNELVFNVSARDLEVKWNSSKLIFCISDEWLMILYLANKIRNNVQKL